MSSLFGDDGTERPPKAHKGLDEQVVVQHYYDSFERRFGFKAPKMYARDKKMVRPYVEAWGVEATLAALDTFLDPETTDPRVVAGYNPDFSMPHFVRVAQYLRVSEVAPAHANAKTARNADAVRRAIGGRKK